MPTRLIRALVEDGFENLAVRQHAGSTSVWYENRSYRDELAALGRVAFLAASDVPPEGHLELIPQNRGVPLLSVAAAAADWLAFLRGERPAGWFRERLTVRAADGGPESIRAGSPPREHLSFRRTDVRVRPLFNFELGSSFDPFRSEFQIAPEAVMAPLPGTLLSAQVIVQVDNDLDRNAARVSPGRSTVSWGGWLPGGWLAALSGGYFSGDRYGLAGETGKLLWSGGLEVTAGGDLSGLLEFTEETTRYSDPETWSAFLGLTHRLRGVDLETSVKAARFMEQELGVRLDVARRFGEVEVGFFGIKTEQDDLVGLLLRLPLPVERWSRPSRLRLTTVPAFPFEYRDSVADVGRQVSLFDNLDRLRKRLYPTFLWNNLEDVRSAVHH
jgi:hypothetical protein